MFITFFPFTFGLMGLFFPLGFHFYFIGAITKDTEKQAATIVIGGGITLIRQNYHLPGQGENFLY
jgi:cytochrome c biogenesis protein CcdA